MGFPTGLVVKNLLASAGDTGDMCSIPGSGRSPGGRNGNPLQYSCLQNPMDRGVWQSPVYRVEKGWTQLSKHVETLGRGHKIYWVASRHTSKPPTMYMGNVL